MAIAEMTQVTLLGRKRDAMEVMRTLQNAGVLHINPLETDAAGLGKLTAQQNETRGRLERQLARAQSTLAALGAENVAATGGRNFSGAELEAYLEATGHDVDVLVRERDGLAAELGAIGTFQSLTRALASLTGTLGQSGRLAVVGLTLNDEKDLAKLEAALRDALPNRHALGHKNAGRTTAAAVAVRNEDASVARAAISRAGLSELRLPGEFDGQTYQQANSRMSERERVAPEALQGIQESMERKSREHAATIQLAAQNLRDEISRFEALGSGVQGQYGFALRGFVPSGNKAQLEAALAPMKNQVLYNLEAVDAHHAHDVPTKLENNAFFKPFELFLGMFAPPAYGAFDPTWVLALFFPLFFGFIIGDIGLGLISLAVSFLFRNMASAGKSLSIGFMGVTIPPDALSKISNILVWTSVWSIVWGFIYGEFFGTLGEHLGLFYQVHHAEGAKEVAEKAAAATEHAKGLFPILIHRVAGETAFTMMNIALLPGIFQVLFGWFMRFRLGLAHGDRRHMFEGIGMFVGLVGLILVAYAYRNPGTPSVVNFIAYACFAVFLVCVVLSRMPLMLMEILSNGGNILSYLRLYAVGLSSAVLANLATDLGWNLGSSIGHIPGILVGIVVATFIHLVAITLTIIGHVLQPLRLHYAEFFTKFGFYDESGRPYKPFTRLGSNKNTAL